MNGDAALDREVGRYESKDTEAMIAARKLLRAQPGISQSVSH